MDNPVAKAWGALCAQAEAALGGLQALEIELGVKQNTQAVLAAALDAAKTTELSYQATKKVRTQAVLQQAAADARGKVFLRTARDAFKKALGPDYSQRWNEVGFITPSLGIPRTFGGRSSLLNSMAAYLSAHPSMEVPNLEVTAAEANTLYENLRQATKTVAEANVDQEAKKVPRDAALKLLRVRLRHLIQELAMLLGPLDPRWRRFGFNLPGKAETPGVPEAPTVTAALPGQLQVEWPPTSGATRYRLYRKVVGVDADFVHVKTVFGTSAWLNSFDSSAHVLVRLSAANRAGEGRPCEPVQAVVR